MKTVMLYRPNTETERQALDYIRDFGMQTGKKLPTMDPDSREGVELCRLYDIMQFPAVLVTDDEGHVQNIWYGDNLPSYSELGFYVEDDKSVGKI